MNNSDGPGSAVTSDKHTELQKQNNTNRSSKNQSYNGSLGVTGSIRSKAKVKVVASATLKSEEQTEVKSESSDTVSFDQQSKKSFQSSDDENLEDTRIQEKSTDERTIKNQLEFVKGIPKQLISIVNDKSDKNASANTNRPHQNLWAAQTDQSAASISNEIKIRKYGDSDILSKLSFAIGIIFNFDTLMGVTFMVLNQLLYEHGNNRFEYIVVPLCIIVFSLLFRAILKIKGDERRHILQCQFNYNFQKKFFKAKKKTASENKEEKTLRSVFGGYFAFDLWENIKVGDIIIIKQHQEFPADCLLLDSEYRSKNEQKNTTVDELAKATIQTLKEKIIVQSGSDTRYKIRCKQSFPGTTMKNRVVETQKVSPLQVVNSFTGNLQWEFNQQGFFCGSFKFTDGTGDYDIDTDNVVKRGSFLRSNHKLVCLVINVGESCMSSLPKVPKEAMKFSITSALASVKNWVWAPLKHEFRTHMRSVRLISLVIFTIFILLDLIQFTIPSMVGFEQTILSSASQISSQTAFINSRERKDLFVWSIRVAIQVTPFFYEIVVKALTYLQAYFAEWDLNLVPASLRFNNLNSMGKLPWISHIVTSPSTLEGNQIYKVTYFRVGDQRFYNQESNAQTPDQTKADSNALDGTTQNLTKTDKDKTDKNKDVGDHDDSNLSFSTSEDMQFNLQYLPHQRNHTSFEFFNQKADMLRRSKADPEFQLLVDFITCVAVCHQGTHKNKDRILEQGPRLSHFRSFIEEEEAQLMFAKQFGCTFANRKSQVLSIQIEDRVERYEELAYIYVKLEEGRSKVNLQVLKPFNKSGVLIINLKGPVNGCASAILTSKGTARQMLQTEAERLESLGFNLQLFCQRELSKAESASFKQKMESLNMYSKTFKEELKALCIEHCSGMKILGMLGFQKVVPIRNALTVDDCIRNGVKVWLLSQYSKRKTLVNCNNMNLMNDSEKIEVFGKSEREIEESLRACFNKIFDTDSKSRLAQTTRADADEEDRVQAQKQTAADLMRQKSETGGIWRKLKSFVEKISGIGAGRKLSKKNFVENRKRRVLIVNKTTLIIIIRDENLMRVFLSLALYCDLMIGTGVNPSQKARLASEIVNFVKVGRDQNAGYVMSIVGSPEDRNLSQKAASDVCCFVMNRQNSKDIEINSDITISQFYSITYLLFKHGSQLHRRIIVACRLHVRKTVFLCVLFLSQYFLTGFEVVNRFKKYFLGIYLTFGFELLAFVTAALYESESFQFLHRINGQYKCNPTLKIVNINMLISQIVELLFDITVILYFSNLGGNLGCILLPNGFTFSSEGLDTLQDILLILYTIPLFMKLPVVNYTTLTVLFLSVLVFGFFQIMNQDFDLMKIYFTTPQTMFQLGFIVLLFALKFEVKRIMRRINPFQSRWDNFNSYVEERLELEQYESWEQLKYIDLENSYNADRLIDVQFVQDQRNMHIITQNLLRLPKRTDLTDIIFEQMNQINKRKIGQSNQMKITSEKNQKGIGVQNQQLYKESLATIDSLSLNFKQIHQEQDFLKYNLTLFANDKQHLKDFIQQLAWLILLFAALLVQIILRMILGSSYKNKEKPANQFVFYIINIVVCSLAIGLIKLNFFNRKDYIMLVVVTLVLVLTIAQVELTQIETYDIEHNITIAVLISVAFINRTLHSRYILVLCWLVSIWCLSLNLRLMKMDGPIHALIAETQDQVSRSSSNFVLTLKTHYYLLGIPVFTLVWSIYIYMDEIHRKTTFLVLSRRIKEFKFSKHLIQRLVPESIRKYHDVRSNSAAVDLLKNFSIIVVKIKNYDQIILNSGDQNQVYSTMQLIQKSLQKVAYRHGVFLVTSVGRRFVFISGVRAFEKNVSQKILSVHHTHRACKFAVDIIQATKEISRQSGVNLLFHAGINSPPHIACGIIGDIRPAFTMIGTGLQKAELICDRAQALQICLSKETYDLMGLFGVQLNIKVNGTTQFFNSETKEIVYELQAKHKSRMMKRPLTKYNQTNLGQLKAGTSNAQVDSQGKGNQIDENNIDQQMIDARMDDLSSSLGTGFSSQQMSDSDLSNQLQSVMTFNTETRLDTSDATYIQTDYQFQMGSEFKDDQEIAQNPVMNATYKLVLRNSWMLSFSNTLELKYLWQTYFELQQQNILFNILQLVCVFLGISVIFTNTIRQQVLWLQLVWLAALGLLSFFIQSRVNKISEQKVYLLELLQTGVALLFVATFIVNSVLNSHFLSFNAFTQLALITLAVFQGQRGWRFRNFFLLVIVICGTLIANQVYFATLQKDPFPKIGEIICSFVLAGIYIHHGNSREVIQRINYNLNMLLCVEDIKNEEYIKRLLPAQAITSIKKEEDFIHQLVDSTIMICSVHGFNELLSQPSIEEKPHIAYQFLKAVYNKFDLLVEHNNQYKLLADSLQYIALSNPSYTTELNSEIERTTQAYKVIQIGQAMIQAVQDTRKQWVELMAVQKEQVDFSQIGVNVLVSTGKLLGYVSGTTFLQYEVFGEALVYAVNMHKFAPKDTLCISETTKKLLDCQTYISASLDTEYFETVEVADKIQIKTYLVKVNDKQVSDEEESEDISGLKERSVSLSRSQSASDRRSYQQQSVDNTDASQSMESEM